MIREIGRMCFSVPDLVYDGTKLLVLVKTELDGWQPICLCSDYGIWDTIGERAGMAESSAIVIRDDKGSGPHTAPIYRSIKMEEYVRLYRMAVAAAKPIAEFFEQFAPVDVALEFWGDEESSMTPEDLDWSGDVEATNDFIQKAGLTRKDDVSAGVHVTAYTGTISDIALLDYPMYRAIPRETRIDKIKSYGGLKCIVALSAAQDSPAFAGTVQAASAACQESLWRDHE